MPRRSIQTMPDIYRTQSGKVISIIDMRMMIENYKEIYKKYGMSVSGQNSLIRLGAYQAGVTWGAIFIPKRFDPAYARGVLGYTSSRDYEQWKVESAGKDVSWYAHVGMDDGGATIHVASPQPVPFVLTGDSRKHILGQEPRVAVVERGGRGYCRVTVQLGSIAFNNSAVFTKVTAVELQRFSQEFERNLRKQILPKVMAGWYPRNLQFRTGRQGPVVDERMVYNDERRFG